VQVSERSDGLVHPLPDARLAHPFALVLVDVDDVLQRRILCSRDDAVAQRARRLVVIGRGKQGLGNVRGGKALDKRRQVLVLVRDQQLDLGEDLALCARILWPLWRGAVGGGLLLGTRRRPAAEDGALPSLQILPHTHILLARSPAARPFSHGIFRSDGAPASLAPASSSLTHARRMDCFCNHNADQLGSLAGTSLLAVYVGVVECAPASPYTYSSSTHRFPDERTPIEATPLSATPAELGSGLGLGLGLGSHFSSHAPSHAPLLLATLLSHNMVGTKVLGNSSPRQILLEDHQVARQPAVVMVKGVCKKIEPFESLPTGEGMDTFFIAAVDRGAIYTHIHTHIHTHTQLPPSLPCSLFLSRAH
jgi:hypothetical protein